MRAWAWVVLLLVGCGEAPPAEPRTVATPRDEEPVTVVQAPARAALVLPPLTRTSRAAHRATPGGPSAFWVRELGEPIALSGDGAIAVLADGKVAVVTDARLAPLRFLDHEHPVRSAALSRDGSLVATVEAGGDVFVWAASGKRLHKLTWANEPARLAAFTSDAKRLVVVGGPSFDMTVRVWDVQTGDSSVAFSIPDTSDPTAIALSRDDKLLALGSERGQLETWSIGPKPARVFQLAKKDSFLESVAATAFSAKGDRVVAAFEDGTVGVWDVATGKPVWTGGAKEAFLKVGGCAFSADGKRVIVGWSTSVRAWDAATGAELQNRPVGGRTVAFSDDARRGLLRTPAAVSLLDVEAMTPSATRSTETLRAEHVVFGPPRVIVVELDHDKTLRVLTPAGLRSLTVGDSGVMVVPSLDGTELAVCAHDQITIWDVDGARPREQLPKLPFYPDSIGFAPDRKARATESFREVTAVVSDARHTAWAKGFSHARGDGFPHLTLAWYAPNALFASDGHLAVLDPDTGRTRPLHHGLERVDDFALSPDGRRVFVKGGGALHRFDGETAERIGSPAPLDCSSRSLEPTFDGGRVASLCDRVVRVITFGGAPETQASIALQVGDGVRDIALAPHGDLLVTVHEDGRVRIWRVDGGQLLGTIRFLPGADAALVETPDGRVELLGSNAPEVAKELVCRVGADAQPLDRCGALRAQGLLADVLAAGVD